jgi:hypothetical protein
MRVKIANWSGAVVMLLAGALLSACANVPNVQTDVDPQADFGQYQSYAFFESAGKDSKAKYATLTGKRMEDAIAHRMEARGYKLDIHHPDLLINYHMQTRDKQVVRPDMRYGASYGYYGYRNGMYVGWPGYAEPSYVDSYTEGTVSVDIVDRRTNQMVWSGTVSGRVSQADLANPDQHIEQAIGAIFAKYPYHAGDPAPVYAVQPQQ